MANLHPTALIDPRAEIADDATVGAYSIIKGPVKIGAGTVIHEHTHLGGPTVIGEHCQIGPAAFVGLPPQHLKADPNIGHLVIGNHVTIRETTTVHRAIHGGIEHATRVGNNCFIMGGVHIGHDCVLHDHVIIANGTLMGGHCEIFERAFLGGGCALHQFVRIGRLAIVGGNERVNQEVPPFGAVADGGLRGYNAIGCRRAGMSRDAIHSIRRIYRAMQTHHVKAALLREIEANVPMTEEVREFIDFIKSAKRGIIPTVGGHRTESQDPSED
jgi:UDP-N-acetylglucosamine acyltransferase